MVDCAIGIDVGGTKIFGGLVEAGTGRVMAEQRVPTPAAAGRDAVLAAIIGVAQDLATVARPLGIGISSAGHVEWEEGCIIDGTPNLPGWAGVQLATEIRQATGLPVCCDNDGNAAAFGEAWVGAGRGLSAVVAVTLGTGFGAGIYDHGHMLRGSHGGGAELGHLVLYPDGRPCNCGQRGCVEAYVSGTALGVLAKARWGPNASARDVFERAGSGDVMARRWCSQFSNDLALTLVSIFNLCDPEAILIGGGMASSADNFLPKVRERLAVLLGCKRFRPEAVRLAALGDQAGMIGAAGEALARFSGRPSQ